MNTAPSYAGIFLWIAFYEALGSVLPVGGLGAALIGLVLAAIVSYLLFYKVFGMLGMKTGYPLYVVGSSTFGTKGGVLFPGIFMGLLQIGWYSVATYFATDLLLQAFKVEGVKTLFGPGEQGFSLIFVIIAIAWGYLFALLGALGIQYVAKMSQFFPIIPLVMLIIAAIGGASGVGDYKPTAENVSMLAGVCLMVQLVVGFFATAGAAGADFGINSRNDKDVSMGGIAGIGLAVIVAGGLGVLAVAGAHGMNPDLESFKFSDSLPVVSPKLASIMALLFAIGSVAPACFCSFIMGNSLSTMIPSLPRVTVTLAGATVGIALAALGIAGNLGAFFGLIGASFGPICGAMVADYLLSGRKWAGPREGISIPGYTAWIIGFAVGICNNAMVTGLLDKEILPGWHPTAVYSFVVGFVVYAILASVGLQGKTVPMPSASNQPSA
jgi:cytosine permease